MKARFWLLDLDQTEEGGSQLIRLWGIINGEPSILLDKGFRPFFYLALEDGIDPAKVLEFTRERSKGSDVSVEVKDGRLFGREVKLIHVDCSCSTPLQELAAKLSKTEGVRGPVFDDVRPSMQYILSGRASPSSWNEATLKPVNDDGSYKAYIVEEVKGSSEDAPPPLKLLAFDILCLSEAGSPNPDRDPIVALSAAGKDGVKLFKAEGEKGEKEILKNFVEYLVDYDPDIIVGFNSNRFHWSYLIRRARRLGLTFSVTRTGGEPHQSLYGHFSVTGRVNIDLRDLAEDIPDIKLKTIDELARFLGLEAGERPILEAMEIPEYWRRANGRSFLFNYIEDNVRLLYAIAEEALPFLIQLSSLTGMPMDQVLAAAVGFRVDSYLMREALKIGEIPPRREERPYQPYRGGLVLNPKPGLHEKVAVLDFTSMYPNLIIAYNISPDTLISEGEPVSEDSAHRIAETGHRFRKEPPGLYKKCLLNLLEARRDVKEKLRLVSPESVEAKILREREHAIKILANAIYGYAGWIGARWYVKEVAESAAALGRATIKKAIEEARRIGLDIIYGDTDSIFVRYDKDKVDELIRWVREGLGLEIRLEKIYNRVLFTEAKKKYAGLLSDGSLDIVGMEVVRGDWAEIARRAQEETLRILLEGRGTKDAVDNIKQLISEIRSGKISLKEFIIWKTLTRPLEDYKVRAPHVEVSKRLKEKGWRLDVGDKVGYIVARGDGKIYERAVYYSEASEDDVDHEYYVENQVVPAVLRILEPFNVRRESLTAPKGSSLLDF
ncbi:MAG: DNA polymerase domain-containing protein [Candidatus Bathyarchaeia archaeon]